MPASIEIAPLEQLAERFARLVESAARRAIADRGVFSMAVSGGSAAEQLLPQLVRAAIDWRRVDVFWVDERAVPPDAEESNYRIARSRWIDHVPLPVDRVHRMRGEDADLDAAAADYAAVLRATLGDPLRFDLVLLGVGPDGHVASLFPGHRLLRTWDRPAAALDDAPKPPPRRLTLTLPVLTAARSIVVFAIGGSKAGAIQEVLGNDESELPLALATMGAGQVTFLLDPEAASKLP
jgi:6-phosphogluconolactonase